jgi:hypothetical protein
MNPRKGGNGGKMTLSQEYSLNECARGALGGNNTLAFSTFCKSICITPLFLYLLKKNNLDFIFLGFATFATFKKSGVKTLKKWRQNLKKESKTFTTLLLTPLFIKVSAKGV